MTVKIEINKEYLRELIDAIILLDSGREIPYSDAHIIVEALKEYHDYKRSILRKKDIENGA